MKKFSLAAAASLAVIAAAPVIAEGAEVGADPFLATQGLETTTLAVLGGVTFLVIIAASSSSGTD